MNNRNHTDDLPVSSTPSEDSEMLQGIEKCIHIHIYDRPQEEEPQSVESTLAEVGEEATSPHEWQRSADPQADWHKRVIPRVSFILILLILLLVAGLVFTCSSLFFSSVTVTIVPTRRLVQTTDTVILATGTSVPGSIPGRALPSLTMRETQTAATTGTTYQSAQPGRGTITFYNAALSPQTIVAGTVMTGRDGIQVATDYGITVPEGTLATNGTATVTAHTLATGPGANIAANDIYGPISLLNMQAQSSTFVGGQEASVYQSVAKPDIDTAVAQLQTDLVPEVSAAFQAQVSPGETLIPPVCKPDISTDHQVGDKATQVQVTVSETCAGLTYVTSAMRAAIGQTQAITHYRMLNNPQTVIQRVEAGNTPGTYTLTVQGSAAWVYQFTQRELATLASHIAGKTTREAARSLTHASGVQSVSFSRPDTYLPSDAGEIHFLFLVQ